MPTEAMWVLSWLRDEMAAWFKPRHSLTKSFLWNHFVDVAIYENVGS